MTRVGSLHARLLVVLGISVALVGMLPPLTADAATKTVRITSTLSPKSLSIAPGTTVVWVNDDIERHRVRSTSGPVEFDSDDLEPGQSFSFRFRTAGSYRYNDHREQDDQSYWGTVKVTSDAPAPAPSPSQPPAPGPNPPPSSPSSVAITIGDRVYTPRSVTIAAGGTVRWTSRDRDAHTVTARGGGFNSGIVGSGGTFSRRFPSAGSFPYFCEIHSDMTGTVTVTGPSAPGGGGGGTTPSAPKRPPSTSAPRPKPAPGGSALTVRVADFSFSPARLAARVGDTVTWANSGPSLHTATANGGAFSSPMMSAGGKFSTVLRQQGTLAYICQLHPQMRGTLVVGPPRPGTKLPPPTASKTGSGTATAPLARGGPPTPMSVRVDVRDFAYAPAAVKVPVGGAVVFRNSGAAIHTASAADKSFDTGVLQPGGEFTFRPKKTGTINYTCLVHPQMTGTIEVTLAAATGPAPAAAPPLDAAAGVPEEAADGSRSGEQRIDARPSALAFVGLGLGWVVLAYVMAVYLLHRPPARGGA